MLNSFGFLPVGRGSAGRAGRPLISGLVRSVLGKDIEPQLSPDGQSNILQFSLCEWMSEWVSVWMAE